jgi:hypothetical protein
VTAADSLGDVGVRLLASLVAWSFIALYWSPLIVAVVRRHPRLGYVAFLNVVGVFGVPWFLAWAQVLAEPSQRRRVERPAPAEPSGGERVVPFPRRPGGRP